MVHTTPATPDPATHSPAATPPPVPIGPTEFEQWRRTLGDLRDFVEEEQSLVRYAVGRYYVWRLARAVAAYDLAAVNRIGFRLSFVLLPGGPLLVTRLAFWLVLALTLASLVLGPQSCRYIID